MSTSVLRHTFYLEFSMDSILERILKAAEEINLPTQKPKSNCKKCHGRGYVGINHDTQEPVPCACIFKKEKFSQEVGNFTFKPRNRAERRASRG